MATYDPKKRPPRDRTPDAMKKYQRYPDRMPGPHAPDPPAGGGVLPDKATRAGAYFIPGFGGVARKKNVRRYNERHAFNPGPGGSTSI